MAFAQIDDLFEDILDFLSSTPTPQAIIEFDPPDHLQNRLRELLDKNGKGQLTDVERDELEEFIRINRFMSRLKLKARTKLQQS